MGTGSLAQSALENSGLSPIRFFEARESVAPNPVRVSSAPKSYAGLLILDTIQRITSGQLAKSASMNLSLGRWDKERVAQSVAENSLGLQDLAPKTIITLVRKSASVRRASPCSSYRTRQENRSTAPNTVPGLVPETPNIRNEHITFSVSSWGAIWRWKKPSTGFVLLRAEICTSTSSIPSENWQLKSTAEGILTPGLLEPILAAWNIRKSGMP